MIKQETFKNKAWLSSKRLPDPRKKEETTKEMDVG
jgi:hypothetical protein